MGVYKKVAGIYIITNIQNNKKYVGHSKDIRKRWDSHKHDLRRNISKHIHLQAAWNLYGEQYFTFSFLELMQLGLTKQQYEEVETKWVLHFKSHLSEFGYNSTLPGSIPLDRDNDNREKRILTEYVCINSLSGEVLQLIGSQVVAEKLSISPNKVEDLSAYWRQNGRRKSLHGWIIIRKEDYDESFDYINYKKEKPSNYKYGKKLSSLEYYQMRKSLGILPSSKPKEKKKPEDIIPHEDRNLKRVAILAHNILTGEERIFSMIKSCSDEFMPHKVYKCINNEFGKYKHRGYWFRRILPDEISVPAL